MNEFFSEFPQFMSLSVELNWKRRDEETGMAVGSILSSGEKHDVVIPVVVDNFELKPFDVMYYDGVTLPLTEETLGTIFSSDTAFKRVVKSPSEDKRFDRLFQGPIIDLQPVMSKVSSYSVIDRISDSITSEQKKTLLGTLQEKEVQAGFEKNNNLEILEKIASVTPRDQLDFAESFSRVLERDIQYIYKEGRFQYKAIQGNSTVDDPILIDLDEAEAREMEKVRGVRTAPNRQMTKEAHVTRTVALDVNNQDEKLVLMNVDGMRKHAFLNRTELEASDPEKCAELFDGDFPEVGSYGVMMSGNQATEPFEIRGLIKSARQYRIDGYDGMQHVTYEPVRGLEEIEKDAQDDNHYYIPTHYRFVKLGEQEDIEYTPKMEEPRSENYFVRDDTGAYRLEGPAFSKYATLGHQVENVSEPEAKWAALQCHASEQEVQEMDTAPVNVRVPFHSDMQAPESIEKVASYFCDQYKEHSQTIQQIGVDLVKEAATMSDETSVDALLSLNLITRENIMDFVQQLPLFEQVLSTLAKLVLSIRLGFATVPEQAAVRAMKGLSRVVAILRGISKLDKIKKSK